MSRLSIVIPSLAWDGATEDTLVSVLQHRPEYSEILVCTPHPYDDPYGLGREVRFLDSVGNATRLDLINHACQQARGEIVHILLPGTRVLDGWTDQVWQHFAEADVGAVAPLVLDAETSPRAVVLGVGYRSNGRSMVVVRRRLERVAQATAEVLGPCLNASFYRRTALLALHGFDSGLGEWLAAVESGLALRELGFRSVVEVSSRVIGQVRTDLQPHTFREGQQAERLYHRSSSRLGARPAAHLFAVAWEALRAFPRWRMISSLCGRYSARSDHSSLTTHEARLAAAREEMQRQVEQAETLSWSARKSRRPQIVPTGTSRRYAA